MSPSVTPDAPVLDSTTAEAHRLDHKPFLATGRYGPPAVLVHQPFWSTSRYGTSHGDTSWSF
ncbi:hypothetical protein ACFW95_32615 [Streptomyces sp. NPDC059474]|uniref:hypothetical protein n=1 Tax=Streptomyces sp. NPDC059474 TaxID=3346846 RepID=UPI00367EA583